MSHLSASMFKRDPYVWSKKMREGTRKQRDHVLTQEELQNKIINWIQRNPININKIVLYASNPKKRIHLENRNF